MKRSSLLIIPMLLLCGCSELKEDLYGLEIEINKNNFLDYYSVSVDQNYVILSKPDSDFLTGKDLKFVIKVDIEYVETKEEPQWSMVSYGEKKHKEIIITEEDRYTKYESCNKYICFFTNSYVVVDYDFDIVDASGTLRGTSTHHTTLEKFVFNGEGLVSCSLTSKNISYNEKNSEIMFYATFASDVQPKNLDCKCTYSVTLVDFWDNIYNLDFSVSFKSVFNKHSYKMFKKKLPYGGRVVDFTQTVDSLTGEYYIAKTN